MAAIWSSSVKAILGEIKYFRVPVPLTSLEEFQKASDAFDEKNRFPVTATLCKNLKLSEAELLSNINGCYPLVHEDVLRLSCAFLAMKRAYGTAVEKDIYNRSNILDFFNRLLSKRPLVFLNSSDSYRLKDGQIRGHGGFPSIGTEAEKPPLLMEHLMTYDEIKLAALVNFSGATALINSGDRFNSGVPNDQNRPFEERAVYVGLVGARFERPDAMESQDILIQRDHNVAANGYGLASSDRPLDEREPVSRLELMAQLFGQRFGFPSYEEVTSGDDGPVADKLAGGQIRPMGSHPTPANYFNVEVYQRRISLSVFPFLVEANHRAKLASKRAYVHVVGLGLGVWKVFRDQNELFVRVFADILASTSFEFIADVDFSYLSGVGSCGGAEDGQIFPGTDIKIHFSRRDPFAKLEGEDASGKLVVASWAYDGNSFIGNEYWDRALTASGDPAAACCSQIPEILNPCINRMISGENLHVATREGLVVSLKAFVDNYEE